MGVSVKAVRTLDAAIPITIGNDPQIIKETMEDGTHPLMDIDVIKVIFLAVYDEGELIGMARLCPDTSNSYDAHIKILPAHRGKKAKAAGEAIWEWITENLKGKLIYSRVPRCCNNVVNFLTLFGFVKSGHIPKAWLKNNEYHDLLIYSREVK